MIFMGFFYFKYSPLTSIRLIILNSKKFLHIFTGGFAKAITLFPFIILKEKKLKEDLILINHERIHIKQQMELLIVFFYILYLYEYLYSRIKGLNHYESYMNISLEMEAYAHEKDMDYLKKRKLFSWWKYY